MPWAAPLSLMLAAAGSSLLASLAVRPLFGPRPSWRTLHWAERARRAWTARMAIFLGGLVLCVGWGVVAGVAWGSAWSPLTGSSQGLMVGLAAWVGVQLAALATRGAWERHAAFRNDTVGTWAHIIISRGHLLVILLMAVAAPMHLGVYALVSLLIALALSWAWAHGAGLRLARALGLSRPASPELAALVARTSEAVGVPVRSLEVLRWRRANAFAFPQTGQLVFTEGALDCLDADGIAAVCAHELGHLAESPEIRRARLIQVLSLSPVVLVKPLSGALGPLGGLGLALVLILMVRRGQRWRQAREEEADAVAHDHEDAEHEGVYARTLEALYAHNLAPPVLGRGRTHPDLYDRMLAAGLTHDYPRPPLPGRWGPRLWVAGLLILVVAGPMITRTLLEEIAWARQDQGPAAVLPLLALTGGSPRAFSVLASAAEHQGEWWRANRFWLGANALDPWDPGYRASAAFAQAREGQCAEAAGAFAGIRAEGWPEDVWFLEGSEAAVQMCWEHGAITLPPTAP